MWPVEFKCIHDHVWTAEVDPNEMIIETINKQECPECGGVPAYVNQSYTTGGSWERI